MTEEKYDLQAKLLENNLLKKKNKLNKSLIQDAKFIKLKREIIYLEERMKYLRFKHENQLL